MASAMKGMAVNYGTKKLLNSDINKFKDRKPAGEDDPYFTYITKPNGKKKKAAKQVPNYIPEADAQALVAAKKWAYWVDLGVINKGPIKLGWGSVLGFFPEIGDVVDLAFAIRTLRLCGKVEGGLPSNVRFTMIINIIIDFFIGLIPILGDIADAAFRCNTKNVMHLEKYLMKKYGPKGKTESELDALRLEDVMDAPDNEQKTVAQPGGMDEKRGGQSEPSKRKGFGSKWLGAAARQEPDVEKGQGRH